jgi:hypothetical protein
MTMGDVVEFKKNKTFTLKSARELLPVVKRITQEAFKQFEEMKAHIERIDPEPAHLPKYEEDLEALVNRWAQKIAKLGCEPKGLWLVDFDNGEGYFCWKHPEEELAYYHTYEGAFTGRTPIL